jgi:hypothetical protein
MLYIFLGFDGVLRRFTDPKFQLQKDLVENLCDDIKALETDVKIIVSSSWREDLTLPKLKSHVGRTLSSYIVDTTPTAPESYQNYIRERECMAWLRKHSLADGHRYLAIDNQEEQFHDMPLLIVNPTFGFQKNQLIDFVKRI